MNRLSALILSCLAVGIISCRKTGPEDSQTRIPEETPEQVEVEDKEGYTVKGYVSCDGKAMAGVVVSDGVNVTRTGSKGFYWLKTDGRSDFVFVSIPSGTEVKSDGWRPLFYHRYTPSEEVQRFDFELASVDNENHKMLVFTDVHISGRTPMWQSDWHKEPYDSLQFREYFVPDINAYAARQTVPVYGLNLGDMMQDMHIEKAGLPDYCRSIRDLGFQTFHVVGNHDHEPDLPAAPADDPDTRDFKEHYMSNLGPRYYSFNIGKVHYVVLDANRMTGNGTNKYEASVTDSQLAWLREDLMLIADKSSMNIVIAMHIGAYRYDKNADRPGESGAVISNRDELMAACAGFNHVYVLSGHAHVSEVMEVDDNVTNVVHPSVSGVLWWTRTCADGTKAAYTVYDFSGTSCKRTLKPYESTEDDQIVVYGDGMTTSDGQSCVVFNIPAYSLVRSGESPWKIVVKENGEVKGQAVRYNGYDPAMKAAQDEGRFYPADSSDHHAKVSAHIFRYVPQDKTARISITATDPWGRTYIKTITLS